MGALTLDNRKLLSLWGVPEGLAESAALPPARDA